jgi:hypothetical protein
MVKINAHGQLAAGLDTGGYINTDCYSSSSTVQAVPDIWQLLRLNSGQLLQGTYG